MTFSEFGREQFIELDQNKNPDDLSVYNLDEYFEDYPFSFPDTVYDDEEGRIQALKDTRIFYSPERGVKRLAEVDKRTVYFSEDKKDAIFFERPVHPDACANIATYLSIELTNNPKINTVVFLDTPLTEQFLVLVQELYENGYMIIIRDHHTHGGKIDEDLVERFKNFIDPSSTLTTRAAAPGCAQLVEEGEFSAENFIVIADNDKDGLLTAMKAKGIVYPGINEDCDILDGNPAEQDPERLTIWGKRLLALNETMSRTRKDQQDQDREKFRRFSVFVKALKGDKEALEFLDGPVQEDWERSCFKAREFAEKSERVCKSVFVVDMSAKADQGTLYDQGTLFRDCIARGSKVLVIKTRDRGNNPEYIFMMISGNESLFDIVMKPKDAERINRKVEERVARKMGRQEDAQRNKHILMLQPFKGICKRNLWETEVLPKLRGYYGD